MDGLDARRSGTLSYVEPAERSSLRTPGSSETTSAVAAHPSRDERGDRQKGR